MGVKPENVIECKKYIQPHTFESDREAVLFYSYIEAHKHITTLHSELEKARKLLTRVKKGRGLAYSDAKLEEELTTFLNEGKK